MNIHIVQIGNGKVAKIHRQNFPEEAMIVALLVRNVDKHRKLALDDVSLKKDTLIAGDLKEIAAKFSNVIWDIVSDDETHFDYVNKILKLDPQAKIMLAKTPYEKQLIAKYKRLLTQNPEAKLTITENYAVSNVSFAVKKLIEKHSLNVKKISIEFIKNRIKDFDNGRFIHPSIGVLGYEGSHMLTILAFLGKNIARVNKCKFEDLVLRSGKVLKNHGSCFFEGESDGSKIIFYTSMDGKVLNPLLHLGITDNIGYGDEVRYRVIILDDLKGNKIIGQYDPVPGYERLHGRILVLKSDKIVDRIDNIHDNTMQLTLEQQLCFLLNQDCANSFPIELATRFVILQDIFERYKN